MDVRLHHSTRVRDLCAIADGARHTDRDGEGRKNRENAVRGHGGQGERRRAQEPAYVLRTWTQDALADVTSELTLRFGRHECVYVWVLWEGNETCTCE